MAARFLAHPTARVVGLVLISRAVLFGALVSLRVLIPEHVAGQALDLLCRWDCNHYLGIATNGYSLAGASGDALPYAFFPVFPLLVGTIADLTSLSPLVTGIALSNVLFIVATIYVYYYSRDLGFSHRAAMLAVALLAFAPPSIVFSAPMTESLFVLLLAAAVFHLRRGHYVAAAIAAALLSGTRPNGLAFVAFAIVWVMRERGWPEFLKPWTRPAEYLPIVLAPLGLFAYWTFSFWSTGDAFAHVSTNRHGWGWGQTGPIETLTVLGRLGGEDLLLVLIGVLALGISFLLIRYRLYAEFALVIASLAFYWSGGLAPVSMARFALVLFPLAVVLGRVLADRPGWATATLAAAATANGLVMTTGWAMAEFVV